MKFKLDENFGPTVPAVFQQRGHDCRTVHQERLTGADDAAVLAATVAEERILVTMDHDFGNVLAYPPETTSGVAVINPPGRVSRQLLALLLESLLVACEQQQLQGNLWIVEPGRIREHRSSTESDLE
jgi:predicted nuclease of predicted toxin-antitoxin system